MAISLSQAASAAPVSFSVTEVTLGPVTCSGTDVADPNGCNYSIVNASLPFGDTITSPATSDVNLFTINAVGTDDGTADSFSFNTTVKILVNLATYTFTATAQMVNWAPSGGVVNTGSPPAVLFFIPTSANFGAPVNVSFLTTGPFTVNGLTSMAARIQVSQAPAVVPLPAGILLLGTALLGLFGLSRRRKLAAA